MAEMTGAPKISIHSALPDLAAGWFEEGYFDMVISLEREIRIRGLSETDAKKWGSRREFLKAGATGVIASATTNPRLLQGAAPDVPVAALSKGPLLEPDTSGGSVTVSPVEGVAGEHGTWTVTYRVGTNGIRQHGGVRVQLPDSWHAGIRNSANYRQSSESHGEDYISSRGSRPCVRLRTW